VRVEVVGVPVPQGSKRVFHGRLVDVNDRKLKDWRALVGGSVEQLGFFDGPVKVELNFYLPRPKGHYGKKGLLPSAPGRPAVKPDVDKLVRACLDAMTGMVFRDDSQVVTITARKLYASDVRLPGVHIEIEEAV
jgi:Holliday junction resolvase RusA-like endonuclease